MWCSWNPCRNSQPNCVGVRAGSQYDAEYFLRGKQTGKSLYENYRWLPDLTVPMVRAIVGHLGVQQADTVLDFGCARGYVVRAFRELGHEAWGVDVSEWAITNADKEAKPFLKRMADPRALLPVTFDWIIAKDVLEHVAEVQATINDLMASARKGVFAVVPLSLYDGTPYVVADYEKDVTHIHRLCLSSWARMFMRPGWSVAGSFMVPGVKANYQTWEWGNGFVTARRL
jgi:SAM-dependent methyltransferase